MNLLRKTSKLERKLTFILNHLLVSSSVVILLAVFLLPLPLPLRVFPTTTFGLSAQKVYTDLVKPEQVHKFTEISHSMVCQCGCSFVLNVCPHTECPWGIPARRLIEHLILSGLSTEEILNGFQNGFGPSFPNQSYPKKIAEEGNEVLVRSLVHGYGTKITAKSSLLVPYLLLGIAILIGGLIAILWYKRNSSTDTETSIRTDL